MGKTKAVAAAVVAAVVLPNVLLRRPQENIPPKVQHGRNAVCGGGKLMSTTVDEYGTNNVCWW